MSKEMKHKKDERKKPTMTLKERRAKKQEKQQHRYDNDHTVSTPPTFE